MTTTDRSGVVCAGSVVVDLTKTVVNYPEPNRMTVIDNVVTSTGGPGMNLAVNLSRLGAQYPISVVGAVGDDANGDFVVDECARLGIDGSGIAQVAGVATSFTDCVVERDGGRRTMFHHPGSSDHLTPSMLDVESTAAKILHVGSPGIHAAMDRSSTDDDRWPNGWVEVLDRAQAAGLMTNMELVDLPADRLIEVARPCLAYLDTIVINELEAGTLTGIEGPSPDADGEVDWSVLDDMARGLLSLGVGRLAVVHVPAGCVAADVDGRSWRQGSVRVPSEEIRSVVGAGDAFAAGVVFGLHEQWPVDRCLKLGVGTAAAAIRHLTTSGGIPEAEACRAEGDRLGYRLVGPAERGA